MAIKKLVIKPRAQTSSNGIFSVHIYKGFSSTKQLQNFKTYDFECIRQDLINQFNTRKGERVMNPDHGTIIWDAIFEPMTESIKVDVANDIRRILDSETRIITEDVKVDEYQTGILLEITVRYKTTDQTAVLKLNFDRELGLVSS